MEVVRPLLVERERLEAVLGAMPAEVTAAEREQVSRGLAELADELRGTSEGQNPQTRFAEMCADAGVNPDDIPDAKRSDDKLASDWLKEKAA